MTILGRRPAGNDAGWGIVGVGDMRGSLIQSPGQNSWLTQFGARCGRYDGGTPTAQIALYNYSDATGIGGVTGVSQTFLAAALMLDAYSGASYAARPSAPIPIPANGYGYILAIRTQNARLTVGQDNLGNILNQRFNIGTSFPSPFAPTQQTQEGRLSLWAEVMANRAPLTPSGLSPDPDSVTIDTTPELGADFRDLDETVGGASVGQADSLSAYQFEVWNDAGTTRLQTSNKLNATTAQKTARRALWTPATLSAGRFQFRCILYDRFGTPSRQASWRVTVSTGGAMVNPRLVPGALVAPNVTNFQSPNFGGQWTSAAGVSTATMQTRVLNEDGTIARALDDRAFVVPAGASFTLFMEPRGWAPLPTGKRYQIELKAMDQFGGDTPWVRTPLFLVNGPPNTPTRRSRGPSPSYTTRAIVSATLTDPDHDSSELVPDFRVRPLNDTGAGVAIAATYLGEDEWEAANTATSMPTLGSYQWSVAVTDPYGASSARSTWYGVNWVTPATITITAPASGTIGTGRPTVTATADRAIASYRVRLIETVTGGATLIASDSGTVVAASISHTVPAGKLRNGRTYTIDVAVTTADGLTTTATATVTVSYTAPAALSNVTAAPIPAAFENPADPASWSIIQVSWTPPTTTAIPDDQFGGYLLRRRSVTTGVEETVALQRGRGEAVYRDRTPQSGETYAYTPVALRLINLLDWVESAPVSVQAVVRLRHTIISEIAPDGLSLPLRYWSRRGDAPQRDIEIIPTLGRKAVAFQGLTDYAVISGQFTVLAQPEVGATVEDQLAVARELRKPDEDELGRPRPKLLCYRDPRGRVLYASITGYREDDAHTDTVESIDLEFTENATRLALTGVAP